MAIIRTAEIQLISVIGVVREVAGSELSERAISKSLTWIASNTCQIPSVCTGNRPNETKEARSTNRRSACPRTQQSRPHQPPPSFCSPWALRMSLSTFLSTGNAFFGEVGSWMKTSSELSRLRKDDDGGDDQRTILQINQPAQTNVTNRIMKFTKIIFGQLTVNEMPQGQKKRL